MVTSTKHRRPTAAPKKQTRLSADSFAKGTPKPVKTTKPNASILSFFKKTDKPGDSLFVGDTPETLVHDDQDLFGSDDADDSLDIYKSPLKRRRLSGDVEPATTEKHIFQDPSTEPPPATENGASMKHGKRRPQGPFVMDSDSEDEESEHDASMTVDKKMATQQKISKRDDPQEQMIETPSTALHVRLSPTTQQTPPSDPKMALNGSNYDVGEASEFDDMDDVDLAMFEGEEMREMRYMKEQARLEAEENQEEGMLPAELYVDYLDNDGALDQCCPICQGSMTDLSSDEATRHVNLCLDGTAPPLNSDAGGKSRPSEVAETELVDSSHMSERFARKAIPKPAQANPLEASPSNDAKSAFSRIMSNNAEDSAWSTAATAEKASRGRPAYQRTCPFYKIIPGFSICVDAFRYGAIEGCKAYFLSHFHSDHYIGLTAKWSHGPIYCSRVTGSLVRKQLRTAEEWVVELDFEKPYDIPGTDGATVTMIPANHCPGSSLFLFQKNMKGGLPRRILHCGDFRACPDHVEHPALRPDILDPISGKIRPQKIDICYLDTTYLSPRYSFPPQEDVIQACADLCASLSPDPNSNDQPGKAAGTPVVSGYFQKEKNNSDSDISPKTSKKTPKQRLLVVCGTYSIGKERVCLAIAKALNTKIFASPSKIKVCQQLGMPELDERLTSNPLEAQVHMQMLMEIRAETLQEYLNSYKPHFSRIIGFLPSGWNFRPTKGKAVGANAPPSTIPTRQLLHDKSWRTRFGSTDMSAQRGSTSEAMCFAVPYSEHSSFRELAMFVMSLRIEKIVPTVNVGSEPSRARMKAWNDRWISERRKYGLVQPLVEGRDDRERQLWDTKPGKGGGAWW